MQDKKEEKMSRDEIIKYVDVLIEEHKNSYDKRLTLLLYEFFLRANEKFDWTKQEFLKKYENFRNNVKVIKIKNIGKFTGYFHYKEDKPQNNGIYLNKYLIRTINKNSVEDYKYIIDNFFHEALHATDLNNKDDKLIEFGLCNIDRSNNEENSKDEMLNEYANVVSASLISSDEPMYTDDLAINFADNGSYSELNLPGSIMCATFGITEIELAKMKDKGRKTFDLYLKEKFPYLDTDIVVTAFGDNLNLIYSSTINKDEENVSLGLQNIVDTALETMTIRMRESFSSNINIEEKLERIYFEIYKIGLLLKKIDANHNLEENKKVCNLERLERVCELLGRVHLYKRFLNNRNKFTNEEIEQIYDCIKHSDIDEDRDLGDKLIESKFEEDYQDDEYSIYNIAQKYYLQSNEPINDNTELIEQIRNSFKKPSIKEKLKKVIEKIKGKETVSLPVQDDIVDEAKFINRIKYEMPIINDRNISSSNQNTINGELEIENEQGE